MKSELNAQSAGVRDPRPSALGLFCLLLFTMACGYHVGGRGDRLPPDVKTIAVPIFANQTSRFRIEQRVTQSVTREFIERTRFRITPDPALAGASSLASSSATLRSYSGSFKGASPASSVLTCSAI
jgi:lipopolysaccharide assembly LptE-like protein